MRDNRAKPPASSAGSCSTGKQCFGSGPERPSLFPSLEVADRTIKFWPPSLEARTGPPNGRVHHHHTTDLNRSTTPAAADDENVPQRAGHS